MEWSDAQSLMFHQSESMPDPFPCIDVPAKPERGVLVSLDLSAELLD